MRTPKPAQRSTPRPRNPIANCTGAVLNSHRPSPPKQLTLPQQQARLRRLQARLHKSPRALLGDEVEWLCHALSQAWDRNQQLDEVIKRLYEVL